MPTKYYKFTGPCKWAKVHLPDKTYNVYSIQVYLDEENLAKYKESGIQGRVKEDQDGTYVSFRRLPVKLIKGDVVELGPPQVEDAQRNKLLDPIGNGSIVTVDVAVYDTVKGKGHTLQRVHVNELVKYERKDD